MTKSETEIRIHNLVIIISISKVLAFESMQLQTRTQFLPARRYASAGLCDSDVSVRPSVCLSHAGIVPSRAKAGS